MLMYGGGGGGGRRSLPTFVVGHSIGAYIALELLRRSPKKVSDFPSLPVRSRHAPKALPGFR